MPGALGDLDVVTPSGRNEATHVGLIEASATGRPVVATAVGNTASVVQDGVTGFLVPRDDPPPMAARLERLLGHKSLRVQMGITGRQLAMERFDLARKLGDVRRVYAELL